MTCVGGIGQVFVTGQIVPIKIEGIGAPVAVVVPENDEFGHGKLCPVSPRIDHVPEFAGGGSVWEWHEAAFCIGLDLFAGTAERLYLVGQLRLHVQRIDDHGGNGHDPRIAGGGQPGGPSAFGGAADNKPFRGRGPFLGAQLLDGIHGLDEAFDHGKEERP